MAKSPTMLDYEITGNKLIIYDEDEETAVYVRADNKKDALQYYADHAREQEKAFSKESDAQYGDIKVGDIITIGSLSGKSLRWMVLNIDGSNIMLFCRDIVTTLPYEQDASLKDITWETCSLRKWLNDDFYYEAFSDAEKKCILETEVSPDTWEQYPTDYVEGVTHDRVYLLSYQEAEDLLVDKDTNAEPLTEEMRHELFQYVDENKDNKYMYWLRNTHTQMDGAITYTGTTEVLRNYRYMYADNVGIIPVINVNADLLPR